MNLILASLIYFIGFDSIKTQGKYFYKNHIVKNLQIINFSKLFKLSIGKEIIGL